MSLNPEIIKQMTDQGLNYLREHDPQPINVTAYEGDRYLYVGTNQHAKNLLFMMAYHVEADLAYLPAAFGSSLLRRVQNELGYRVEVKTPGRPLDNEPPVCLIEMIPPTPK